MRRNFRHYEGGNHKNFEGSRHNYVSQYPPGSVKMYNGGDGGNGVPAVLRGADDFFGRDAANFTIRVTRNSANIDEPLPFMLFGSSFYQGLYAQDLPTIPGQTAATVEFGAVSGDDVTDAEVARVRFSFTTVAGTDTVDVTCSTMNYPTFLEQAKGVNFLINLIKYRAGTEAADVDQFSQPLEFGGRSLFGPLDSDTLDPFSFQSTGQEIDNLIDIPVEWRVTKNRFLTSYIKATSGIQLSFIFSVSQFNKMTNV